MDYITVAEVRAICGITTKFISTEDFTQLANSAEAEVERLANTPFIPKTCIEQYTPPDNQANRILLRRNPILKIRALTITDTVITPEYTRVDKQGGLLWLTSGAELTFFQTKQSEHNLVRVKYDYGLMEDTFTNTITSNAEVIGDSVVIEVASTTGFTALDYVEIAGMDSMVETVKIESVVDGVSITVDNLSYPHEAGSTITLQAIPAVAKRLCQVSCAMMAVARVVGQSFDEITGYQIGDEHVQKGEPYTQWREVTTQLRKEWDDLWKAFRPRPAVA